MTAPRLIALAGYVIMLLVALAVMKQCNGNKLSYIGWAFLALHGIAFYVAIIVTDLHGDIDVIFFNLWSAALRVHSQVAIISMLAGTLWNARHKIYGC